jgi:hypothetical protein
MKRALVAAVVLVGLLVPFTSKAGAQYPTYNRPGIGVNPYSTPPISPYFNLARGPGTVSQRYFNLYAPQQQFNADINRVGQQIFANQQNIQGLQQGDLLLETGHPTRFMSHQRYFLNQFSGGVGLATGIGGRGTTTGGAFGSAGALGGGLGSPSGAGGLGSGAARPPRGGR